MRGHRTLCTGRCLLRLTLSFVYLYSSVLCISIEKEVGTGKNIDITSDPGYKLLPRLEKCGFSADRERPKRVTGGRPASPNRFPWMVQLYLTFVNTGNSSLNCGGTLITSNVVLTAAHCVSRLVVGSSLMSVAFGQSDRAKIKVCKLDQPAGEKCSKRFTREVKKAVIHEDYSETTLQNDLALLFLDNPVRFSSKVRPICLPYAEELLKGWVSTKVGLVGWGVTAKLDEKPIVPSQRLMGVDVHIRKRSYCNQFHTRQYGVLEGNRFCAGGEVGGGGCNGDSGGPLQKPIPVPELDGKVRAFQIGIVSSGAKNYCGYEGLPHIFTNVLYHMPWILKKLSSTYTLDSAESFSAELNIPSAEIKSSEEEIDQQNSTARVYKTELSTGLEIDVNSHPNLSKLPSFEECGNIIAPKRNKTVHDNDDFDDSVEVEYDEESSESGEGETSKEKPRPKRMVGGRVAGIGWFPFFAQIYHRNALTGAADLRCGGMIISSTLVLTAASCVTELPHPWALDSIHVGSYNRNKTEDCLGAECFKGHEYSIKEVKVHPAYEKFSQEHNIAMVRIAGNFTYTRMLQPICLPTSEQLSEALHDMLMVSVGYGRVKKESEEEDANKNPKTVNIPKYIEVKLKPRSFCDRNYKRYLTRLSRAQICGGRDDAGGECDGDTGGPLLKPIRTGSKTNKYVQFGIISADECGQQGLPTVYTNIIYYLPWIMESI